MGGDKIHSFWDTAYLQVQTVRVREGKYVGCNPQPVPDIWPQKPRMLTFTAVSSGSSKCPSFTPLGSLNFCNSCPEKESGLQDYLGLILTIWGFPKMVVPSSHGFSY